MTQADDVRIARERAANQRRRTMANPIALPLCAVCNYPYPHITHMHHVKPLAETKAISEETTWLCPNCHAMVHELRRVYFSSTRFLARSRKSRLSMLDYWMEQTDQSTVDKLMDIAHYGK